MAVQVDDKLSIVERERGECLLTILRRDYGTVTGTTQSKRPQAQLNATVSRIAEDLGVSRLTLRQAMERRGIKHKLVTRMVVWE